MSKRNLWPFHRFEYLFSVLQIDWTTSQIIIAYKFVMVLIASVVALVAN